MFKFTTIYYRVDDEEKLESFFSSTHVPLAEQLPSLVKIEVSRIFGKPGGGSRFHLAYSLYFATQESFQLSMVSEAGLKLIEALMPWYESGLIVWYYADVSEVINERAGPEISVEDLLPKRRGLMNQEDQSSAPDEASVPDEASAPEDAASPEDAAGM